MQTAATAAPRLCTRLLPPQQHWEPASIVHSCGTAATPHANRAEAAAQLQQASMCPWCPCCSNGGEGGGGGHAPAGQLHANLSTANEVAAPASLPCQPSLAVVEVQQALLDLVTPWRTSPPAQAAPSAPHDHTFLHSAQPWWRARAACVCSAWSPPPLPARRRQQTAAARAVRLVVAAAHRQLVSWLASCLCVSRHKRHGWSCSSRPRTAEGRRPGQPGMSKLACKS